MTGKSSCCSAVLPASACLVLATLAVFWPVATHDFIRFDDPAYVTENPVVRSGLTGAGVAWAFTRTHAANWHPLTWISHMLDVQFFGLNPGWHHLTSLLLHLVNVILLFVILLEFTSAFWRSALVAALFAIHPLHVESVAWVAERKDVLSTFFWLLTMGAYLGYARRGGVRRYLLVALTFSLGLMAKPMLVTLPFVLLLLDFWPLGRAMPAGVPGGAPAVPWARLLGEKVPLILLSALSATITYHAQASGGGLGSRPAALPLVLRAANAACSYARYILRAAWPLDLAVFYPLDTKRTFPVPVALAAVIGLCLVSWLALRAYRRRPYLAVGWLWYLGTLVPVIGLIQVGWQSMADRYTYVPLIGLFIALSWGAADLVEAWRVPLAAAATAVAAVLLALMVLTGAQVGRWKNTTTLFEHALASTSGNWLAHYHVGNARYKEGKVEEAIDHYRQVVALNPDFGDVYNNLGLALAAEGHPDAAIPYFNAALKLGRNPLVSRYNLALALTDLGRRGEAEALLREVLRSDPGFAPARKELDRMTGRRVAPGLPPGAPAAPGRPGLPP